jgi:hypothetical protein
MSGVVTRAEWQSIIDPELAAVRKRLADRKAAHDRQRDDARIVAEHEARVALYRAHSRVREMVP